MGSQPNGHALRPGRWDAVYLGIGLGALLGLLEFPLLMLRRALTNRWMGVGLDALWLAPAVYIALFAAIGLIAGLVAGRQGGRQVVVKAAIAFQLFVAGFAALSVFRPVVHETAVLLLAAGITRVGFGPAQRALVRWNGGIAWRGAVLLLVLMSAVGGAHGVARLRLASSLADRPAAPRKAPNVLLLILDTVRATDMAIYRHLFAAPGRPLELASSWVLFERAYSTAPWTLPSHASLFTGRRTGEHRATWYRPMGLTWPTLAEVFRESGYFTAATMANFENCSRETGLDRGFDLYRDYPVSPAWAIASTSLGRILAANRTLRKFIDTEQIIGRRKAPEINREVLELAGEAGDRPWLIVANYFDAHAPYIPPAPYDTAVAGLGPAVTWQAPWRGSRDSAALHTAYRATIQGLEGAIDDLLDSLPAADSGRGTVVIITSDHGEEFGEHGTFEHGHDLYPPALHVPLLIMGVSEAAEGTRVDETVSLLNLPATLVDLAGISPIRSVGGRSLRRHWEDDEAVDDTAFAVVHRVPRDPRWSPARWGDIFAAIAGSYEYIERQDRDRTLLDLAPPAGRVLAEDDPAWDQAGPPLLEALNTAYPPAERRISDPTGFSTGVLGQ